MKKLITIGFQLSVISMVILFSLNTAQAAPVGSPASLLEKGMWDISLEGGYLNERPMESEDNAEFHVNMTHGGHGRSYALTDRITIKAKIGGSYGYLYDETVAGASTKTSLGAGMALGLQLKGIIFEHEYNGFEWDGSAQFLYLRSHHKRSGKGNADWYEWQVASCVAKEMGPFKPYAGLKFSTVDLDYDDGEDNVVSYDDDGNVGPFIGTDIYFGEGKPFLFNVEASFLMGIEVSGGLKYRF
jgi:hypothetical protein